MTTPSLFQVHRVPRRAAQIYRIAWIWVVALLWPGSAMAGSFVTTVQPNSGTTRDSYLRQDNNTEKNGGKTELDLNADKLSSQKQWNLSVNVPVSGLAGKSVLQAWLRLSQFDANANSPIKLRAYPLIESWVEPQVSWDNRDSGLSWTTPGGTRGPNWSDWQPISDATIGSEVTWQVGPIMQAWQTGDLPSGNGFLLVPDYASTGLSAKFRSSEYTTDITQRPRLTVYYTDEAPAVRSGTAEIQPQSIQVGASNVPMTLWLDVNGTDVTPSGSPTGLDRIFLNHGGALIVTAVDQLTIGGVPIPAGLVSWIDNGSAVTFQIPNARIKGKIRLDFRVTVLADASSSEVGMPVLVDDGTTTGAWSQMLWPGNADGIAGNGDGWSLAVTNAPPVLVRIQPDTATVANGACVTLQLIGQDAGGNQFGINADTWTLVPANAGTLSSSGTFCASKTGTALVIGAYGSLKDTATVTVVPAPAPTLSAITLRTASGAVATSLAPSDTMLLDFNVTDALGFKDIQKTDLIFYHTTHSGDANAPAFRAAFTWNRAAAPTWGLVDPVGSSWQVVSAACLADTITNTTTSQTLRLAFVTGTIARASTGGEWSVRVVVEGSNSALDSTSGILSALNATPHARITTAGQVVEFAAGPSGSSNNPLAIPSTGRLDIQLVANADYSVSARLGDLIGVFSPLDSLFVHRTAQPFRWALNGAAAGGGAVDTSFGVAATGLAPTGEAPVTIPYYLWSTYAGSQNADVYSGPLTLRSSLTGFGVNSGADTLTARATVTGLNQAAHSAAAEVLPHSVTAGSNATFDVYLSPRVYGGDTGVNWIQVGIPSGYGTPVITQVSIAGSNISFTNVSRAGAAVASLGTRALDGQLVRVRFSATVPTQADTTGADFPVQFDDLATAPPAQSALQGDANGIPDGDNWRVKVTPAGIAALAIAPRNVAAAVGDVVFFGAGASDAYGNAFTPAVTWSVTGGIGTITAGGQFTASNWGDGLVIVRSGALSDTARVGVASGLAAHSTVSELIPHTVVAGSVAIFDAYFLPRVTGTDTGVNWLQVALPAGYGIPVVSVAQISGLGVPFRDASKPGAAIAVLSTGAMDGQPVHVRFSATVPTATNVVGSNFTISFDDTATTPAPQVSVQGDANGVADGDNWRVTIGPATLARIAISPRSATCAVDSTVAFSVVGKDAYNNSIAPALTWTVKGGIGTISTGGVFTATAPGNGQVIASSGSLSDTASVTVSAGLAGHAAIAEVLPHSVAAGSTTTFDAYFLPRVSGSETGVNWIQVAAPLVTGTPRVTSVQVAGVPVGFRDASRSGATVIVLPSRVKDSQPVWIRFTGLVTTTVNPSGADFPVTYDDTATSAPAQSAAAGNANGIADGDHWHVTVGAGPLAILKVSPASVVCALDSVVAFTATGQDAYGNAVGTAVTWSVAGGIGTITTGGSYRATTAGTGFVIAQSGAVADSARVTVAASGLAAHSALAEVSPHIAAAGAAITLDAYLLPRVSGTDTGVNWMELRLPTGWGTPAVSSVQVAGSPTVYRDASRAGAVTVVLSSQVLDGQLLRVRFTAVAPTLVDYVGGDFPVSYDDTSTSVPAQSASQGDANGVNDGDTWRVAVGPGTPVRIVVSPTSITCGLDSLVSFSVTGQDAYNNPVSPVAAWRISGAIGTISNSGVFHSTTAGTGFAVASIGALADSAAVTVRRIPGLALRTVTGPQAMYPGQSDAPFTVDLENLSAEAIRLDSVSLTFTRFVHNDAASDFQVLAGLALPAILPAAAVTRLPFAVNASASTATGYVTMDARAYGVTLSGAVSVRDTSSDTTLALSISTTGLDVSGMQHAAPAHPGDSVAILELRLRNRYPEFRTLQRLTLENRTSGPGTQGQLDHDLGDLVLRVDDGDGVPGPGDTPWALTRASGASVSFEPLMVGLPPGRDVRLFVVSRIPLDARDGDKLDVRITSALGVGVSPASTISGNWPLDPTEVFPVDGLTARQLGVSPVPAKGLSPGSRDQLALDVRLPANGYQRDTLERLAVVNFGTAVYGTDLTAVKAWMDDGDGVFRAGGDRLLGALVYTGNRWDLSGLSEPIAPGGVRVFLTVDAASLATESRTVRLALPPSPGEGVGMFSGNDGPIDQAVANPYALTITNQDRVSLEALPTDTGPVHPGDRGVVLSRLRISNTYASDRTLDALVVTNATSGSGATDQLDGEIRALSLRSDGDGDGILGTTDADPVLGTVFFRNGRAEFSGFRATIPSGEARQFFVTADVSLSGAADGDMLGATLSSPAAVGFLEPTTLSAAWPIDSGTRRVVDGFVATQLNIYPSPNATVSPGDGPLLALDLVVPPRGYLEDVLRSVRLVNLGTARASDLASLQLWRDGGDGAFTGIAGGDSLLGGLTSLAGGWQSPLLSVPVGSRGGRLFVTATFSGSATDSATLRLAVPRNGITCASGNDGPLDQDVDRAGTLLVSTSPILATVDLAPASVVGQLVTARMIVRNVGTEPLIQVTPDFLEVSGAGVLTSLSGPFPASATLAPAAADTFTWNVTASLPGDARLSGGAQALGTLSQLVRVAPRVSSGVHRVYGASDRLSLSAVKTMPVSVRRGQTDVVPFGLTLTNPRGTEASDVKLRSMTLRLEDESGSPVAPGRVLSRIELGEGTQVYSQLSPLDSTGQDILLSLSPPAIVSGNEPTTLTLRLSVLATTGVTGFRVVLLDSQHLEAVDANSQAPVTVALASGTYPIRSDIARIVDAATSLEVAPLAQDSSRVGRGRQGVTLLRLQLDNPGIPGITSDVRLSSLALDLKGAGEAPLASPERVYRVLRVRSGSQTYAARSLDVGERRPTRLTVSPPLNLPAGSPVELSIEADLASDAPVGRYRACLAESLYMEARDANNRTLLPVTYSQRVIEGPWIQVEAPAETLLASGVPRMPEALLVGQAGVGALNLRLRHPGSSGMARIRLDSLGVDFRDASGRPLASSTYLSRLRLSWNGVEVGVVSELPALSSVNASLTGLLLEPGDSGTLGIAMDVNPAAPSGTLQLLVPALRLRASDANTGLPVRPQAVGEGTFPLGSGFARLESPSRQLSAGLEDRMPAVLTADARPTLAGILVLTNTDSGAVGPVSISHLVVRASDRGYGATPLGAAAIRVEAYLADTLWARSPELEPDSMVAQLVPPTPLELRPGMGAPIEFRLVPRLNPGIAAVRIGLGREDIGVIQPASALLAVSVLPQSGRTFPLWTQLGSFAPAELRQSYSNFPNPFAAGRQSTTVAYYLARSATVGLRILSARGDEVIRLLRDTARPAGLHQEDRWDGRNGQGQIVRNGVFVAELTVRYGDGSSERLVRKVAVVR